MLPATRNDAISVSSKMLICATEEPNSAGSISLKIRRTPSCASPSAAAAAGRSGAGTAAETQAARRRRRTRRPRARARAEQAAAPPSRANAIMHDIQQHGRERRDGEPPVGIQDAARERRQRHEQQVREREPQHRGAVPKRRASSTKPGANTRISSGAPSTPTTVTPNSTSAERARDVGRRRSRVSAV